MRKLPQQRLSGVWVRALEDSIFYEGASDVPAEALRHDPKGEDTKVWLDSEPDNILEKHGYPSDGEMRAYRVDFLGTKSDALGAYGHNGMFRHGVLMQKIIKVEPIPLK